MAKSPMVKRYGVYVKSSLISRLRKRSDVEVSERFKPYVENVVGQRIRKVVCYEENLESSGYCNTCAFEELVVNIYFKSVEGYLCKLRFVGGLPELISILNTHYQNTEKLSTVG